MNTFVSSLDSTYPEDFWGKPGYLGTERSSLGDVIRHAVVDFDATVSEVSFDLEGLPGSAVINYDSKAPNKVFDLYGYDITVFASNGTKIGSLTGTFDEATRTVAFNAMSAGANDISTLGFLSKGVRLNVNNKRFTAFRAYPCYQVPERAGFYGFNQFRSSNGSAKYPQRSIDASKTLSRTVSGGQHTGNIQGKIIVIQNLMDSDAFPWHADWYRSQVLRSLGDTFHGNYRIWYQDNAEHYYEGPAGARDAIVVPYSGFYEQAMRDLAAWVEFGTESPKATAYTLTDDNSVRLRTNITERGGIQPMITLNVGTNQELDVKVNKKFSLQAEIITPPGTGKVVSVDCDFFGVGNYIPVEGIKPNKTLIIDIPFVYNMTGTFIATVRVGSHREGDQSAICTKAMNLARIRINVSSY